MFALTISWFKGWVTPTENKVMAADVVACPAGGEFCQLKGPTDAVTSVLPLNANASYKVLSGPAGAPRERQLDERVGGWPGTG